MKKELFAIINKFRSLKSSNVNSSSEFILAASQIQELSSLLTNSFYDLFIEEICDKSFFKNYLEIKKDFFTKTECYNFGFSESDVILYKSNKEVYKSELLNPEEILNFLTSGDDELTEDQKTLIELFFSNETIFSLLNYSICYLNFTNS